MEALVDHLREVQRRKPDEGGGHGPGAAFYLALGLDSARAARAPESLGIFGSVLADATSPRDVDVVFTARWRSNNRPLPEASYYPFDVSEPTNRVSRALSRGSRRMDLSSHYLLEVERLGAPYRIVWTRDEGCVDRPIITPKKRRSKHVSAIILPIPRSRLHFVIGSVLGSALHKRVPRPKQYTCGR